VLECGDPALGLLIGGGLGITHVPEASLKRQVLIHTILDALLVMLPSVVVVVSHLLLGHDVYVLELAPQDLLITLLRKAIRPEVHVPRHVEEQVADQLRHLVHELQLTILLRTEVVLFFVHFQLAHVAQKCAPHWDRVRQRVSYFTFERVL